jgi:hypothetical protein
MERHETQVQKFLESLNFRFRKIGSVPAKALTEEKKRTERIFGLSCICNETNILLYNPQMNQMCYK